MCLAIYKPAGVTIPRDHLESGFNSNPHGAGFALAMGRGVEIIKGFFTFDAFCGEYEKAEATGGAMLVHFRLATHGLRDAENCHPFYVKNGKTAMIHNGIIDIPCPRTEMSDTWHFNEAIIKPIARIDGHGLITGEYRDLIERAAGYGNKIAIMDGVGAVEIIGDGSGERDAGGVWYSNNSWRPWKHEGLKWRDEGYDDEDAESLRQEMEDAEALGAYGLGMEEEEYQEYLARLAHGISGLPF